MKKQYLLPRTDSIRILALERQFCASELENLEEKNDLGGFDWDYNP